ncbi:TetR/AcrR family transcriptional regulator [Gordonia neofelifaecis]|uniref:TetR family transcriptional regulator n=1 Tax=Gordonia neofelifaecis NRRL B-59395 TaxID=644548 RepID=F1YKX9_9ACTN|nr:TetR/AcrR family transcriptional regulator [Gordonia neofelifaecis]EGD54773.1 TetR family transcriptional regulator [Gordonia neofelifaecis NRRL B-59395]
MVTPVTGRSEATFFERAMERVATNDDSAPDPTRTKLLDAAYEQFCESGIARTSMEEVARRAGTARITIYRKFDTKDALVDAVMIREFENYFVEFLQVMAQAPTPADRVIVAFVTSLRTIGGNPLIRKLLETEPALVPGFVGGGDGRTLTAVRDFVAHQILREQTAGNIPKRVRTIPAADLVVRIAGSFLTIPSDLMDYDDPDELAGFAREFLLPVLGLK